MMDTYIYVYVYIWLEHWNGSVAPPPSIAHWPVVYVSLNEVRSIYKYI